ncbi:amidohydrolase family protein [Xanthocytophaga flava]|uniref:amidohydrolase family protein n=1 Tax=Xanthocytophaga flava TaxID=3048013 RepID=UPI0028D33830|nr:amidohydrolase family protein [Xanthocytophaga flavus]MDJ1468332.1 amidohydrolase family protein [Xanthocytophaga flavus]
MKKIYLLLCSGLLCAASLQAQPPIIAKPQSKAIALKGATIHIGNGQVVENGVVVFENGKISAVGNAQTSTGSAEVIDAAGKHIYPGVIAPNTNLGLDEVSAVKATQDKVETGMLNPNVRSLISYNTDSEHIYVTRDNGVLIAQTVPEGGVISGTSSIVQLDAWNWEDAAYRKDDGIWMTWPAMFSMGGRLEAGTVKKNDKRGEVMGELDRTFKDAYGYSQIKNPSPVNLKLEAMKGLYDGTKTLFIHTDYAKEIVEAVNFAKSHNVKKYVIVGGDDAYLIIDFLKENNVPVLLNSLHRLPGRTEEDVDMPYKLPAILHKAGILVGLAYEETPYNYRNVPFIAGQAAGHGLSKEEALQIVTLNNAKILGIDTRTGTLETGKDANIVVSTGDLLDMRTNNVTEAFIQGRKIVLDDKQKRLYKRFSEKYGK